MIHKLIKIILAILFFICLLDMPYGYYQLVRFVALIGFGILAYKSYQCQSQTETILYLSLALLFQPIIKIALGRPIWNVIDIIVGIGLIISVFLGKKK